MPLPFTVRYTSAAGHRWQTVWDKALAQALPLEESLDTGTGTGTGSGTGATRRLRQHGHSSGSDSCRNDKFRLTSIYINEPSAERCPIPLCLREKQLRMIELALGVMISGNAADDG